MDDKLTKSQSVINAKPTTTFVHVDTITFREVVQRLTSQSDKSLTIAAGVTTGKNDKVPPILKRASTVSKLHERRKYSTKPKLEIVKSRFHYPSAQISPSLFPAGGLLPPSPVTPSTLFSKLTILEQEQKRELSPVTQEIDRDEEEKAVKQRRFYLHPSPRSKPGYVEPELLSLFPQTSPRTEADS
uniref:VQ domain-containing protein n=1 Tax=Kalanchoe fedtschenkoi TaxID=63787 RepID=A0A7N0TYX0_KALFE